MTLVGISQRVEVFPERGERRDSLDQRWNLLLKECQAIALPLPNCRSTACELIERLRPDAVILSGGGDLVAAGGDAPERDEMEQALVRLAVERSVPLLGVCRGMQVLLQEFGAPLVRVTGHLRKRHQLIVEGESQEVNSFHDWGSHELPAGFQEITRAPDGSLEAMRHDRLPLYGIMWHPERENPFGTADVARLRRFLGGGPFFSSNSK